MRMETTKIKILLYNAENLFIVNEFLYKFTKITVMIDDLRKIYYNVFQHQKYELKIAKWRKNNKISSSKYCTLQRQTVSVYLRRKSLRPIKN